MFPLRLESDARRTTRAATGAADAVVQVAHAGCEARWSSNPVLGKCSRLLFAVTSTAIVLGVSFTAPVVFDANAFLRRFVSVPIAARAAAFAP